MGEALGKGAAKPSPSTTAIDSDAVSFATKKLANYYVSTLS